MRAALVPAVLLAAAAVAGAGAPAAAGDARRALDAGFDLYGAQRYEEAAARFGEAAVQAGEEGLDPHVARYDGAIALLRAGKAAEAAGAFSGILSSSDPRLRESAHYHRGIALETAADAAEARGEAAKAVTLLGEALGDYESAMLLDPHDEDPKVNHELASRKKARLEAALQGREKGRGESERTKGAAGAGERPEAERPPQEGEPRTRQAPPPGEMRPEDARALLDAVRQHELSQRSRTRPFRGEPVPVGKDW